VKRFLREGFNQTRFIREIETLAQLNHPCILRIRGWKPATAQGPAEIRTEPAENGALSLNLEKAGHGAQFPFWNANGKAILICGIALGMRYVHWKGIIHGDLKPSNILMNGRGEPLVSDFGSSRFETNDYTLTGSEGTVNYAAPELCKEAAIISGQIDVYGFGLIAYEILTGTAVFPRTDYAFPILKRILNGDLPSIPDECGSLMQALIPQCWSMDPGARPTFDAIVQKFKTVGFRIVPKADAVQIRLYVGDIEKWEAEEAEHSRSH
jgi:abelson tyrosine-protein kinase 1/abelson tyrosine-protein kinase 2